MGPTFKARSNGPVLASMGPLAFRLFVSLEVGRIYPQFLRLTEQFLSIGIFNFRKVNHGRWKP